MTKPTESSFARALVVDDDDMSRLLAEETLASRGITTVGAANGREAIERLEREDFDIVLLDVEMPEVDGFEVCAAARRSARAAHTPILMLTGLDDVDSIAKAYRVGATDFVNKPINWLLLGHRVEYILRSSRSATQLRQSRKKLEQAHRLARIGSWDWQRGSDHLRVSKELGELLGFEDSEVPLRVFFRHVHPEDRSSVREAFECLQTEHRCRETVWRFRANRGERILRQGAFAVEPDDRVITGVLNDITESRRAQERIHQMSYYDSLTGLPNRRSLQGQLGFVVSERSQDRPTALFLFDLDRFSTVNDSLGHRAGDRLLRAVAERLQSNLREADRVIRARNSMDGFISRIGGDEFVVLCDVRNETHASDVVARLRRALDRPFTIGGQTLHVTASVGVAVHPSDGRDADVLLRKAHMALHHAKDAGRNGVQFFDDSMNQRAFDRLLLESRLSRAIQEQELLVHYQPQYSLPDQTIVGVEALVRWKHEDLGLVSPDRFIPLAEESGLITQIDRWVLETACAQARQWREQGYDLRMSVNLSSRSIDRSLVRRVAEILERERLHPSRLDLEITESSLVASDSAAMTLKLLKELHVGLALDDFGTGYSSLSYIRKFPFDTIKIDRSFLADSTDPDDARDLTGAIIALAHRLGMRVVAEGLEHNDQLRFLCEESCDEVQGFLFSRGLPARGCEELFTTCPVRRVTENSAVATADRVRPASS